MLRLPTPKNGDMSALQDSALSTAFQINEDVIKNAENSNDLTHGMVYQERVATSVLAIYAANIVLQERGTLDEYLTHVNTEIKALFEKITNDPELKPYTLKGEEVKGDFKEFEKKMIAAEEAQEKADREGMN